MFKLRKITVPFLILLATALSLVLPSSAHAQEANGIIKVALSDTMTFQREDGSVYTIDNTGTMRAGYSGQQIVIDVIHAGVVRETGEQVDVHLTAVGDWQRIGNHVEGDLFGQIIITRAGGNQVEIDITASYAVSRLPESVIRLVINGDGVVQGSGENIVIDVIGAGVITE